MTKKKTSYPKWGVFWYVLCVWFLILSHTIISLFRQYFFNSGPNESNSAPANISIQRLNHQNISTTINCTYLLCCFYSHVPSLAKRRPVLSGASICCLYWIQVAHRRPRAQAAAHVLMGRAGRMECLAGEQHETRHCNGFLWSETWESHTG